MALARPVVDLELTYEVEDEQRTDPFNDWEEEDDRIRARLDIGTSGWIYHPAFMDFRLDFQPGWKQEKTTSTGGFEDLEETFFAGYTFEGRLLPEKRYTVRLFSDQSRDEYSSTLFPSIVTRSLFNRVEVDWQTAFAPLRFSFGNQQVDVKGLLVTHSTSNRWRFDAERRRDRSQTVLRSEYVDEDRQVNGSGSQVERLQSNIYNTYRWRAAFFSTSLYGSTISTHQGDTEIFNVGERVDVTHRRNLRSNYELRFESQSTDDFSSERLYATGGVIHELYENLTSTLEVLGDDFTSSDGGIKTYEGTLDFNYRRPIPMGSVGARTGVQYRVEDNDIRSQVSQVVNEPLTLTGTAPSFLEHTNVIVASIVITDSAEAIVYQEGFDYVTVVAGVSTAIQRTLFGGIADGQQVLIDYRFIPQAPFTKARTSYRVGFNLRLWSVLRFFYTFNRAQEDLLAGTPPNNLADDTIHRMGSELSWRWSTTRLEYEDRDTTIAPLTRFEVAQLLSFQLRRRMSFDVAASYSQTDLLDTGGLIDDRAGNTRWRWRVSRWGSLEVEAYLRSVVGPSQDSDSLGAVARFFWWFGAWRGSVQYHVLDQDEASVPQTWDRQLFSVQVRRRF
jgi:hypothetical protein